MINPNKDYYMGVVTRLEFKNKGLDDLHDRAFKYAVNEPLQVWAKWSIALDRPIITKVRRAPKFLIKK
jgi:hypothetical protein